MEPLSNVCSQHIFQLAFWKFAVLWIEGPPPPSCFIAESLLSPTRVSRPPTESHKVRLFPEVRRQLLVIWPFEGTECGGSQALDLTLTLFLKADI